MPAAPDSDVQIRSGIERRLVSGILANIELHIELPILPPVLEDLVRDGVRQAFESGLYLFVRLAR